MHLYDFFGGSQVTAPPALTCIGPAPQLGRSGEFDGRAVPEVYRWDALVDDLLALLGALAPTEPVDGIGASMGTATLLHAAARAPQRFRRLVLTIPPTAWETRAAQAGTYLQAADLIEQHGLDRFRATLAEQPVPPVMAGQPPYALPAQASCASRLCWPPQRSPQACGCWAFDSQTAGLEVS